MEFHFSQGKQTFPDGKFVKFKELEIRTSRSVHLTIRIYPSNTYVTYHNDYKKLLKTLYKQPHQIAQKSMADWLDKVFYDMRLGVGGSEYQSALQMYQKLVKEPLE